MSRSPSPANHCDQLEAWLNDPTSDLLPNVANDLQRRDREQRDGNLDEIIARDSTQSYSHKEMARITGAIAHNLIIQLKRDERNVTHLEQDAATLKLQAKEAWRNQEDAQTRLDWLTQEYKDQQQLIEEEHKRIKNEARQLHKAISQLHTDTEHREQQEKTAKEELGKLLQAKSLLVRAKAEQKERDAKSKAYENHLQAAQAEIQVLVQQHHQPKDERDSVQKELLYGFRMQAEPLREKASFSSHPISVSALPHQSFLLKKRGVRAHC